MNEPDDSGFDEVAHIEAEIENAKTEHNDLYTEVNNAELIEAQMVAEQEEAYQAYLKQQAEFERKKTEFRKQMQAKRDKVWALKHKNNELLRKLQVAKEKAEMAELEAKRNAKIGELHRRWDKATLRAPWREWAKDHQIQAGHFITENRRVILADPMGLGKTLSSIIACDMLEGATREASKEFPFLGEEVVKHAYDYEKGEWGDKTVIEGGVERPVGKRVLYFCPSSLIRNVLQEFRQWSPHRSVTYVGGMSKAERQFAFEAVLNTAAEYVVICNYEAWARDKNLIDQFIKLNPDTVILDEAHILKNPKTSAYKGINRLLQEAQPELTLPMTGTPILNRPQELFYLLTLVNSKEFFDIKDFLYTYCEQTDDGFWKFQTGGIERIAQRIRRNFMRRTKDQAGIVLPDNAIIYHDLEVDTEAYPNQARVRKQMREYATIMIGEPDEGKSVAATAIIAMYTRLRQIETWPAAINIKDPITKEIKFSVDVEESQKLDYIITKEPDEQGDYSGLIPEVISDERVVVFSQFRGPLYELKKRIEKSGYRAVVMDGSVTPDQRDIISRDFDRKHTPNRSDSKWDVVLCHYRVGGVGLNLTAATQTIVIDEEWNPGKRDQAYARTSRIGQTEKTTVHVIRNQKTIDEWLANIMDQKEDMVEGFNTKLTSVEGFKEFLDDSGLM